MMQPVFSASVAQTSHVLSASYEIANKEEFYGIQGSGTFPSGKFGGNKLLVSFEQSASKSNNKQLVLEAVTFLRKVDLGSIGTGLSYSKYPGQDRYGLSLAVESFFPRITLSHKIESEWLFSPKEFEGVVAGYKLNVLGYIQDDLVLNARVWLHYLTDGRLSTTSSVGIRTQIDKRHELFLNAGIDDQSNYISEIGYSYHLSNSVSLFTRDRQY